MLLRCCTLGVKFFFAQRPDQDSDLILLRRACLLGYDGHTHKLLAEQHEQLEGDDDHELGSEEIRLGNSPSHDVGPPGQKCVSFPRYSGGGSVDQNGETVEQLADPHRPDEVITECMHPLFMVNMHGIGGVVALFDGLKQNARGDPAAIHSVMDTLTGQRIDHTRSIADDDEVLVGGDRFSTEAETSGLHVLDLEVGAEGSAEVAIVVHEVLVPMLQVVVCHIGVAGDDVAAIVQLVVGVSEQGSVARKESSVVEHHTVGLEFMGATFYEGARAGAGRCALDVAQVRSYD